MRGIPSLVPCVREIADANGWVYVDADDEYDAIANAIYADVVSTNGSEYQFGEGFASNAFTLSPNSSFGASAADLNWYLNLNNQEGSTDYTGFAKIQVAPVIEEFYVYDANNSADSVSPGDPTTQTFDVIPDSDGDAAVDLNAILSDDSSAVRQDTLWTLSVDHDSEIVASGSLSSDGSDTYIALPSGYTQYTLKYGFDLNGDGDLSNSAEIQRVVTLDIATHAVGNLTAQGIYATAGESFSGAGLDIYSTSDALHFAYWTLSGDSSITAQVTSEPTSNTYAKVGLMMRSSLAANSPEVSILRAPSGAWYMESRTSTGGSTSTTPQGSGMTAPVYLQLVQSGTTVTGYYSYSGAAGSWTELGSVSVSLGSTIYAGLAVVSHNTSTLETATFANVSVTGTPASPSVTAAAGDGYNTLSWNAVSDATSYNVYRSTSPGGEGSTPYASNVTGTSMTDIGVADGTTYYYKVTAVDSAGESTPSGEVSATPNTGVIITTSGASTATEGSSYSFSISLSGSEVLSVGSVSVDWGDGDTQSLSVSGLSAGGGTITTTHTYESAPATPVIQVSTSIDSPIGTQDFSSSEQSLSVTHAPPNLSISGSSTATAGSGYTLDLSGSEVGDETISQWTIDWGDGSTPQVVTGNPSSASYTYANGGSYVITATATDTDSTYNASGSVSITAGGITITPVAVQATVGQSFSGVLATIADTNGSITPDDFSWTIDWGDGTSSDVGSNSSGGADSVYVDSTTGLLTLAGTHTYAETSDSSGPYTISITLSDGTNTSTIATAAATVTQLFGTSGQSLAAQTSQSLTDPVLVFGSVSSLAAASNYTATIYWGNGDSASATISADGTDSSGNSYFLVAPTSGYAYSATGNYSASVVVTDTTTGEQAMIPLAVSVDAVTAASGQSFEVDAGSPIDTAIATFSTTNVDATADQYEIDIAWGDGDTSIGEAVVDGTDSSGDPIFSVVPLDSYVYQNSGPQDATITVTDDNTGGAESFPLIVASETEYAVHIVNTTVLAEQLTTNSVTYNPSVGSPDANGWVYVKADDEYDAIANAIYADVVSTNGSEYQFGQGFASDAFTLSPNTSLGTSAADLNWYLNLNNQEGSTDYTGFAKMQVAPVIDGFYVYDDNNPNDEVTPPDATTQTLDVVPNSDGNAAVDLNAILSDESSAVRQDTLWTLSVDHDSEIVASGGLSSDGSDTLIDLPSGYTQYTLKYGFDLNGDGDLSNGAEIQRVVTIDVTSHAGGSLSAQDIYTTAGQTFTGVVATFSGDSTAAASDFNASVTWGDGNITAGTVVSTDGGFEVDGSHLYSSTGIDAMTVNVWPDGEEESNAVTANANAYVRDSSLAADWEFQTTSAVNSTVVDTSGNGNAGTINGDAVFNTDINGITSLTLDGSGGGIVVGDNTSLDPTDEITLGVWINATEWSNGDCTIIQKGTGTGQYSLSELDGQLVFSIETTEGEVVQAIAPETSLPSIGVWHYVVATYDDGRTDGAPPELSLYVDGTLIASQSSDGSSMSIDSASLEIGDKPSSTSMADAFDGEIEAVSVYDDAEPLGNIVRIASPVISPDVSVQASSAKAVLIGAEAPSYSPVVDLTSPTTIAETETGVVSGGNLADQIQLKWTGAPGDYYWVYYTDTAGVWYASLYNSPIAAGRSRIPVPFTLDIDLSSLGITSDIGTGATGDPTIYFTIVATTTTTAPVIGGSGRSETGGIAAASFCAPQIYFIAGDGDTNANGQRSYYDAEEFEANTGAQVHLYTYDSPPTASDFPPQGRGASFPIVLMGQSFGGSSAAGVANDLSLAGSSLQINLMMLFDPVAAYLDPSNSPQPTPTGTSLTGGGTASSITVGGNVTDVYDFYTPSSLEFGSFPTGPVTRSVTVPTSYVTFYKADRYTFYDTALLPDYAPNDYLHVSQPFSQPIETLLGSLISSLDWTNSSR